MAYVVPPSGPLAGGVTVTVTGTGLMGASVVDFGTVAATNLDVVSADELTVTSPAEAAGRVDVTVTTPSGKSALVAADSFVYQDAPTLAAVSPSAGPVAGASTVVLTGTGFVGASAVSFATTAASSYSVISATEITTTSPAGSAGVVDVTVTTPSGTSATSAADEYTYEAAPAVSGVSPAGGPLTGGTTVTITGSGLSGASGVSFGSSVASSFTLVSGTEMTALSPAEVAGPVDVTVTTPVGTSGTSSADRFTYEAAPLVSGVSPVAGPLSGDSAVTVTGTGFSGTSAVSFGSTAATSFEVVSPTEITVVSPSGTLGVVDVSVTTPAGTSATSSADEFTYEAPPVVSSLSPAVGPLSGATPVVITGTGFVGASAVYFATTAATSYSVVSSTRIDASSPELAAGAVDVTVTTPSGQSATSSADEFTYEAAPTVTAVSPLAGPLAGGTQVQVDGTNFTGASALSFGNSQALFTILSSSEISATSPGEAAGSVDVTVTSSSGTSATSAADVFSYEAAPAVSSVSPSAGLLAGGTTVLITGSAFTGTSAVSFGSDSAASYSVLSTTEITAVSPSEVAGTLDVTVTTPVATSATSSADQFVFESAPAVSALSQTAGPVTGGNTVTITGSALSVASAVYFGTTSVSYNVVSPSEITATAPAEAVGTVDVTVTTPVGTSATSAADLYSFEHAPVVSSIVPSAGPPTGDTLVVVTGLGFTAASAVNFGTTAAASYTVVSASDITATSPVNAAGTVDLTVTTPVGTSAEVTADSFSFEPAPAVSSVSPVAGALAGGTSVAITGTAFTDATSVSFASASATNVVVHSATSITATAPAGTGTVDVTVTTPVGESATSAADEFTYEPAPAVSAIAPAVGLPTGGANVTITGANFTEASAVSFGDSQASSYTVSSATEIVAVSPASLAGSVDVTVTTPVGTSVTSAADRFLFESTPVVSSITPSAGPTAGASAVTITGTGFGGASAVEFGSTPATNLNVVSANEITATSPAGTPGTVDVTVTTASGTSATSSVDQFTYEAAPVVSSLSPLSGPTAGGTPVVVTGSGFVATSSVDFGTNAATSYTVVSASVIDATSPAAPAGTLDLTVTTPVATSATSAADQFTYQSTPSVASISPPAGSPVGGTSVTITGTNLTGASAVHFGSQPGTNIVVVSSIEITVVTPAESAGQVDVTVTTPTGTSATSASDLFSFETSPAVATLSPAVGNDAGGESVTVTGVNFTGASAVDFDTASGTNLDVVSASEITVTAPQNAPGPVYVTVVTSNGTSATGPTSQFTYEAAPSVTSLSTVAGLPAGGSAVTVTGTGFVGATGVSFGSLPAASYTVVSSTEITTTSPGEPAGSVDVTVTTPVATSATGVADQFTYEAPPAVASLSPVAGSPAGGTVVTVTGTGFSGVSAVSFGAIPATYFNLVSATEITATSPGGAAGTVELKVTTPSGTNATSATDQFTYEAAPVVSSLTPGAGLVFGGTSVTISGSGFVGISAVSFGSVSAASYVVTSPTEIAATSPAESAGHRRSHGRDTDRHQCHVVG